MSEMVDRVADALAVKEGFKPSEKTRKTYAPLARAAIEAMREPTEAMTDAVKRMEVFAVCGEHEATVLPDLGARPGLQSLYRAMISAALT